MNSRKKLDMYCPISKEDKSSQPDLLLDAASIFCPQVLAKALSPKRDNDPTLIHSTRPTSPFTKPSAIEIGKFLCRARRHNSKPWARSTVVSPIAAVMPGRVPFIRFFQRIKNPAKRQLVWKLAQEVWNTPDCEHFTEILIKYFVFFPNLKATTDRNF